MVDKRDKVLIACDHGGFEMKNFLKGELGKKGYSFVDYGTSTPTSVDYPDFIHPLANEVNKHPEKTGIIICGSGNGAQITANKYINVRAALCWSVEQAKLARQHNNANIISLPGRFVSNEEALEIALNFLSTAFEGGRHTRRVEKISSGLLE